MGRIYGNPPLIEAVCEFQFEPSQPWDWTIPGLIYDKVKGEFPKKKQKNAIEMELRADQEISQTVKGGVARMQFLRENEGALLQVGPNVISAHHYKPYPAWHVYREMIKNALAVYRDVANPKGLKRIGLRYINRLMIKEGQIRIEDYILAVPHIPEPVPQIFGAWFQRVEVPHIDANGLIVIQSGSPLPDDPNTILMILDLDFVTLDVGKIGLDATMDWVDRAHDEIEKTFEACITDKTRELFKEVENA